MPDMLPLDRRVELAPPAISLGIAEDLSIHERRRAANPRHIDTSRTVWQVARRPLVAGCTSYWR